MESGIFSPETEGWFKKTLGEPTEVQKLAWPAIAGGEHVLVSAPTGTGKTLSAFLVFIDRLKRQARDGLLKRELQVIYISPLKSLAGDIRENLRRPLTGITNEERMAGIPVSVFDNIEVAVRTGDTPSAERQRMAKRPPHILITTPESLYIMLTSASGQKMLKTARAIIIDELHALIDAKRGAHLMLSIARLDRLCGEPLQRIGLSATLQPLEVAAEYLSPEPAVIAAPKMKKSIQLIVKSADTDERHMIQESVWNDIANTVYELCKEARTVIAFVEGRAYAERLAYFVNLRGGKGFARTHHGSLSKEHRLGVEEALRSGEIKLLCATSSMELGIDVGDIDQVFQIGCPFSVSSLLQRLGRAGHNPGRTSVMYLFPRTPLEALFCGMTAHTALQGGVEHVRPPMLCLDVLAQHLVSMANGDGYTIDEVLALTARAYPFRDVTEEDVRSLLGMLAGDYEHHRDLPVRPRVLYDRINGRVEGDAYSRMLALSGSGTIPDKGLYSVKNEKGAKLGELDEEFVFETKVGDRFQLGTFAWQIVDINKDSVIVRPTSTNHARLPFWHADFRGRGLQTGLAFGRLMRRIAEAEDMTDELMGIGLDEAYAKRTADLLERQMKSTGALPDDRTIVVEHFQDEGKECQLMIHSIFGNQINAPLAMLVNELVQRVTGCAVNYSSNDDGLFVQTYSGRDIPDGLLAMLDSKNIRAILAALLPATPVFSMTFRYNAAHALMMGVKGRGRQPLWIQRLRSTEMLDTLVRMENHPLIRETKRECLNDYWDIKGLTWLIEAIKSGEIKVVEVRNISASPMSLPMQWAAEGMQMYNYAPTTFGITNAVSDAVNAAIASGEALRPGQEELDELSARKKSPDDEKQLHSLFMMEGDMIAGEVDIPVEWLELLAGRGQAMYIEPGLWIAAEHAEEYAAALQENDSEALCRILRRCLRYRGAQTAEQLSGRYLVDLHRVNYAIDRLVKDGRVRELDGVYYHADIYDRARRETVKSRRNEIVTQPPEKYAQLLARRLSRSDMQVKTALAQLCDLGAPAAAWESILLPARVDNYRPAMLDGALAEGGFFWRLDGEGRLYFHASEDIDWEAEPCEELGEAYSENAKTVYQALLKRGAGFTRGLASLLGGTSPSDALLELTGGGLICADSLVPVRQWLNRDKLKKAPLKKQIGARVAILSTAHWEPVRSLAPRSAEDCVRRCLERYMVLGRENIEGISWGQALEVLRIWEYTGQVRRGYFISGMSGMQFVLAESFREVVESFDTEDKGVLWLSAVDPFQPWGKHIPHEPGKSFMNVAGTAVALIGGRVAAVTEKKGRVLRIFDEARAEEIVTALVRAYQGGKIYTDTASVTVKQYPKYAAALLSGAGFIMQMQDYVFYRK